MFTWGPKFLFAVSLSGFLGALIYGLVTGGEPVGVISGGYKGGVGDHTGYAILLAVGVTAQVLTWILVATRDGDVEALAARVGADTLPAVAAPADPSYWGIFVAFGLAGVVLGLSLGSLWFYLGLAVVFVGALQWLMLAWSDRATGDVEMNRIIRRRVVGPFEVPVMATLAIAIVVILASRVFLAVPEIWSVVAGGVATIVVFGGAVLLSMVDLKPAVVRSMLVLSGVVLLAGGVAAGVVGERDFHHGEGHDAEPEAGHEGEGE
ncbi:MAG: hypothetical protein O3C27_08780 [Actinomycetota bacterium]|nr:hypothetical protein [Actinomycetota bacterium]